MSWEELYSESVTKAMTLCCRCGHYAISGKIQKDETDYWVCFACMTDEEWNIFKERNNSS